MDKDAVKCPKGGSQCEISPYHGPEKSCGTESQASTYHLAIPKVPSDALTGRTHLGKVGWSRSSRRAGGYQSWYSVSRGGDSQSLVPPHARRVTQPHGRRWSSPTPRRHTLGAPSGSGAGGGDAGRGQGRPPWKRRTAPAAPRCPQVALPAAALGPAAAAPAGLAQPPGAGRSPWARPQLLPRARASPARPPRCAPRRPPRFHTHTHADTRGAAAAVRSPPALAASGVKWVGEEPHRRRVPLPRSARLRGGGASREVGERRGEWRRPTASTGPCDSERRSHTRTHPPARSRSRCRAGQRSPAPSYGEPTWSESSVPPPGKAGTVT